jgi:hypothetical protein
MSRAALQARAAVQQGATLYRVGTLGRSAGPEGQYWSLQNPIATPGYATTYGLPAPREGVTTVFVEPGELNPGAKLITRSAPGIGSNTGGAIEVVTDPGSMTLNGFFMPGW